MSLLEVVELDQFYGDLQALFGVSLRVEEGEVVAIIGANGAGKSTLLKTIVGLLPATAGAIRWNGEPIADRPTYVRVPDGISMVPEDLKDLPGSRSKRTPDGGRQEARPGTGRAVNELFPMLSPLAKRRAAVLSGGEQQTVAIGRALMSNPRLLLMDEISLGLAPIIVKGLYEAVPSIAADGTTLVVVEQDVSRALRIADRAYCFLEGRISLQGRATDLGREEIRAAYFGI